MSIRVANYVLLVAFCAVVARCNKSGVSVEPEAHNGVIEINCNVTGVWRNDLGSLLKLHAVGSKLKGAFLTAVETSPGAAGSHGQADLTGFVSEGAQPTFTFSVLWEMGSCTSWVGQCFILPNGERVLKTQWMLRSVAKNPTENWLNTRFGGDQFALVHAERQKY